jgi:CBS domain-containing protein
LKKVIIYDRRVDTLSSSILVRDMMSTNIKTVSPDLSLTDVIKKMVKFNISCIMVMDQGRHVGIITERDILKNVVKPNMDLELIEAKAIMSRPLITILDDATIEEASRSMLTNNIKKLPVVRDNRLVGILTSSDIVRGTNLLTGTLKDICLIGRKPLQE